MSQQPGFYRRALGDVTVTALNDGTLDVPITTLTGIPQAEAAALLAARFLPPAPRITVNAFLLQGHGRTILVDTGGGGMAPTTGRMLSNLRAAGVQPDEVDLVLLTHLHSDHSGMLAQAGAAVFPRAELALSAIDAAFWLDEASVAAAPEARRASHAAARAAVAPYRDRTRLLSPGAAAPGITMVPLPGHTPGHSGYRVEGGAESLLIWGDIMHVPAVQAARPEATVIYDLDPAEAAATRRRVLDMAAAERMLVAGMHLDFPALAHVTRAGDAYALVPETWSPS